MNKYQYAQEVCEIISMKGYETEIHDNSRNNSAFVGVMVKTRNDEKISPIFNITGTETLTPEEFADQILSTMPATIDVNEVAKIMDNKTEILSRCHYILVNSKMNEARTSLLRRPVNKTLELQYKIDIDDILLGGRVPIEQKHLDRLGLLESDIYKSSIQNTMAKYPAKFVNIQEMLPIELEGELPMYVLTNTSNVYGAGAILYQGMKKLLEETVGEFVVIPSSVHETIIIPKYLGDTYAITQMIREVNSSVVGPEDMLSDRPYELVSDGVLLEV